MRKLSLIMTGVLLVLCMVSLSGCSSKVIKENKVFDDIKKSDTYCSTFDFVYDSMEVVKRMTDEEEKTDNVWVNFTCHNDDFEYTVECIVNYVLYNEGWIFEGYEVLNSNYTALIKPTVETVLTDFPELESVVEWEDDSFDLNTCMFSGYRHETVSEFFTWDYAHSIMYEFTPEEGWVGGFYHNERMENWNWDAFLGKWETEPWDSEGKIQNILNITKINSNEIEFEYEISHPYHNGSGNSTFKMEHVDSEDNPYYGVNINDIDYLYIKTSGLKSWVFDAEYIR